MDGIHGALAALTHGVYVLGVHTPEKDNLMTAAWLCQVSSRPPMVAAAVSSSHLTAELIPKAAGFSVSVLRADQKNAALKNGTVSGRALDKLSGTACVPGQLGHPIVEGAAAYLECRLVRTVTAGDHTLFIGEVLAGDARPGEPLLYRKKDFFP